MLHMAQTFQWESVEAKKSDTQISEQLVVGVYSRVIQALTADEWTIETISPICSFVTSLICKKASQEGQSRSGGGLTASGLAPAIDQ